MTTTKPAEARDLLGAWTLVEWAYVYADGRPDEHPMGPDAKGFIIYTPDGHVSATLMTAAADRSFAYAGRYEVREGTVYHSIQVATVPSLVGITSSRQIALDGERLDLSGPDFSAGSPRTQRIRWKRP